MKIISSSKYFKLFIFAIALTASSFVISSPDIFAIANKTQTTETAGSGAFCKNLTDKTSQLTTKIDSLSAKLSEAWDSQSKKSISQFQQVDEKVDSGRSKADETRTSNFKKLEAKASSEKEKSAVQAYELAVNSAVTIRRTSYDNSRKEFRTNLQHVFGNHKNTTTAQLGSYKASINNAIADAKNGCMSDSASSMTETRTNFRAAMKNAQESFRNSRLGDDGLKSDVNNLISTRNDTFKAADRVFKDSMDLAKKDLITAFGAKANI